MPDRRLFVFYYVKGVLGDGQTTMENRLLEIQPDAVPRRR